MKIAKPVEDITQLKIDIEIYKKKIEELNCNNCHLSNQFSKLTVEKEEKEAEFQIEVNEYLRKWP